MKTFIVLLSATFIMLFEASCLKMNKLNNTSDPNTKLVVSNLKTVEEAVVVPFTDYAIPTESDSELETKPTIPTVLQSCGNVLKSMCNGLYFMYKMFEIPENENGKADSDFREKEVNVNSKKLPLLKSRIRRINFLKKKKKKTPEVEPSSTIESESSSSDESSSSNESSSSDESIDELPVTDRLTLTIPHTSEKVSYIPPATPSQEELTDFWSTWITLTVVTGLLLIFGLIALLIVKMQPEIDNLDE